MAALERSLKTEAVVLRHNDMGEADRLLTLFSRDAGIIRAVAKGTRRIHSKKAGHLEPFTRVSLMLARTHDLWLVTQAVAIDLFLPLRDDLVLTGEAAYVLELVDRFSYEEGENRNLYNLLVETLERLSRGDPVFTAVHYFELHMLDYVGFRPQLFNCVHCHEEIKPQDQYFSAAQGGAVCPKCGELVADARPITMDALKYLRNFQRTAYTRLIQAVPSAQVEREVEAILQYYNAFLLERRLNTPRFLDEVRKNRAAG
ncbi:MAG: DNA repair protein RecO [Chloroflexi bacterium]|nr:DNA repair protein RecO [Chloroflexota bacterium]BCY16921.1 DNA repair protein RecO [Leptolinea sp. HRD-7]